MNTVSIRRKILFLLLVMVLATPWDSVAGLQRENPRTIQGVELGVPEIFSRIWSFLRGVGSKVGCHIDPDGRCTPTPQPKIGCNIDPWGRCVASIQPKAGCNIDPDGRCIP
jgi:hypothetical protein